MFEKQSRQRLLRLPSAAFSNLKGISQLKKIEGTDGLANIVMSALGFEDYIVMYPDMHHNWHKQLYMY